MWASEAHPSLTVEHWRWFVKVLSLLPSATEIVYALGGQETLVGVSCDCDYPEDVSAKPVVSA
jgi:iron complex transport system substrate-binding protein